MMGLEVSEGRDDKVLLRDGIGIGFASRGAIFGLVDLLGDVMGEEGRGVSCMDSKGCAFEVLVVPRARS